jgi:hypothetical protein
MKTSWSIEADYFQACNCDYGCPCEFSAPPTTGFCEGVGAWKINRGKYAEVTLDGLGFGFAAKWPKAIHEGNGTVCLLIDERATAEQRNALIQIGSGQAGGLPFEILATTFSKLLDPLFVPFHFEINGTESKFRMGDAVVVGLQPIKNPVTKEPESVTIIHSTGFVFKEAICVSADEMKVSAREIQYSYPGKAGFVSKVKYAN